MFVTQTNPMDNVFNNVNSTMNTAATQMQGMMEQLNMNAQNGTLPNPAMLLEFQMEMQSYLTLINTCSSVVKQYGDVDKTIAQNIGV